MSCHVSSAIPNTIIIISALCRFDSPLSPRLLFGIDRQIATPLMEDEKAKKLRALYEDYKNGRKYEDKEENKIFLSRKYRIRNRDVRVFRNIFNFKTYHALLNTSNPNGC